MNLRIAYLNIKCKQTQGTKRTVNYEVMNKIQSLGNVFEALIQKRF